MLGCHDFCGYYEWTFHFVRRKWGTKGVARLWAEAIGGDSQQHYSEAACRAGLAGLYHTWVQTGKDEACDWTFTLDEARNLLRWDMRRCPSKGFLLAHDLNADEDYCDHCMGWMIPLLSEVGVEVWEHEHNHLGQCWGTMRCQDRPSEPIDVDTDIRRDPRWNAGYLDRWENGRKQPLIPSVSGAVDSCQLLLDWFSGCRRIASITEEATASVPIAPEEASRADQPTAFLMTDRAYLRRQEPVGRLAGILIGCHGNDLAKLAMKFNAVPPSLRPLLLHAYLPRGPSFDWTAIGLPRPVPILPLLIRIGQYVHVPGGPAPDPRSLLSALARALATQLGVPVETDQW